MPTGVMRRAAENGILVMLAPAYLGYDGGGEGWYKTMVANGPDKLRSYGEYLGRRYREFTNILWVHGRRLRSAAQGAGAGHRRGHSRVRCARSAHRPRRP